ncbi:IclR family transcriptional regulator [Microbacterium sediminicola]|uniref:IclR family transcriptional regulator n=1 Tax=Microbacterium sediminicola TaxID=415210 RepID=A0ABN2HIP8_9MICO
MARASGGESVLHKHLRVLDAFDARHPFRTLSEIAAESGLAVSTAHRLIAELEAEGMLERLPDKTYRLGVRLWEYAARTPGALGLRELARPWLGAVHARVRQHTQLAVRSGLDALFVERMSTPDAVINATLIGGRIPLPLSSSGLVLLAAADPSIVDQTIERGWPLHTSQTIRDGGALRRAISKTRSDGFAVAEGQIHEASRGIAVPVYGPHNVLYAALGVVVPNDRTSPLPAVEVLALAAAGIRHALEEVYLPADAGGDPAPGIRALLTSSRSSLDYLAELDSDQRSPVVRQPPWYSSRAVSA